MRGLARAALALALAALAPGLSADAPPLLDDDPSAMLGLTVSEALSRLGPPSSVAAVRGDEAWQDDVAFVYAPGYTLFLYGDRLWQLRLAAPYAGSVYGLFLGDSAEKACSLLGQPFESGPEFLLYRMPYKAFPVRLRLVLAGGRVVDAYLYRADV
jgi:hypothetical protein